MQDYIRAGKHKELKVILKGDVQGSVEALATALLKLTTEDVRLRIVHQAVGSVTENDINLAGSGSASEDAGDVVIAFNEKAESRAQALANEYGVTILSHEIIYEVIDRVRALMAGLLEPEYIEEELGQAEVRATFNVSRLNTTVAGCMVTSGLLERNARIRVMRDGEKVHESTIASLRNVNQDVKQMRQGFECGVVIDRFNGVREGDILECYRLVETTRTL
jgi:translation initiation factor IF-2